MLIHCIAINMLKFPLYLLSIVHFSLRQFYSIILCYIVISFLIVSCEPHGISQSYLTYLILSLVSWFLSFKAYHIIIHYNSTSFLIISCFLCQSYLIIPDSSLSIHRFWYPPCYFMSYR